MLGWIAAAIASSLALTSLMPVPSRERYHKAGNSGSASASAMASPAARLRMPLSCSGMSCLTSPCASSRCWSLSPLRSIAVPAPCFASIASKLRAMLSLAAIRSASVFAFSLASLTALSSRSVNLKRYFANTALRRSASSPWLLSLPLSLPLPLPFPLPFWKASSFGTSLAAATCATSASKGLGASLRTAACSCCASSSSPTPLPSTRTTLGLSTKWFIAVPSGSGVSGGKLSPIWIATMGMSCS
mmetsp:Transcript_110220/g.329567  ORF Transcript_110220/g.329567 Transcript_110220/m.329567 type:complete len:245 (-) Transcript_110220:286-1020(-)